MHSVRLNPYGCCALVLLLLFVYIYFISGPDPSLFDGSAVSIRRLLSLSIQLAKAGGKEILKVHSQQSSLNITVKHSANNAQELLTAADSRSNDVIVKGFLDWMPDLKVISEEHSPITQKEIPDLPPLHPKRPSLQVMKGRDQELFMDQEVAEVISSDMLVNSRGLTVWVDPLDATQEFTENLVQYVSVMIGISLNDRAIAGVIHFPFTNVTYWAWKGFGVSHSLEVLQAKRKASISDNESPRVLISRSHAENAKAIVDKIWNQKAHVVQAAGSGYKMIQLIAGQADVYLHTSVIKKWDVCAPHAVLIAMQGFLTTCQGGVVQYETTAAASTEDKASPFYLFKTGILATFSVDLLKFFKNQCDLIQCISSP